jgi:hypothetical protein
MPAEAARRAVDHAPTRWSSKRLGFRAMLFLGVRPCCRSNE